MCDTIVVVNGDRVLFAKNSDRDANEPQLPEWHPAQDHPEQATVKCAHIEIPQVAHTYAVLISRPFWMWGAEMGSNEFGVTIGNEAVFTDQPYADAGLTGMDLLRLALERSRTKDEALDIIVDLIEKHGQGGGCGYEKPSFTYHNSFIVADRAGAIVLETAGKKWATEAVTAGVRTISNGLTIAGFADRHRDKLRSRVAACDVRTTLTSLAARDAVGPGDLMSVLRSHGGTEWPQYRMLNGTLTMPCMHGGGLITSSSSTAGWVSDLAADTHWVTGTSAQCLSLFKPMRVDEPVNIGVSPGARADSRSLWWRHERLARRVMQKPQNLAPLFLPDRDEVETEWLRNRPPGQLAFDEGSVLLDAWAMLVAAQKEGPDNRPWYTRRYWNKRALPV